MAVLPPVDPELAPTTPGILLVVADAMDATEAAPPPPYAKLLL
jgi:hypothetical protein